MAKEKIAAFVPTIKVAWNDPGKRDAFFRKLGASPNAASVWASLATATWDYAAACRASNEMGEPDAVAIFTAFANGRETPGGGGKLSKASADTYQSIVRTVADVAYKLPYDGTVIRDYMASKVGSVAFGSRAKLLRDIAEKFPARAPSDADMKKLQPEKDSGNLSDALASHVKRLTALATDDATSKVIAGDKALTAAYKAALAAAKTLAQASVKIVPLTPEKTRGTKLSETAASLLA